mmetsp:Transcript_100521/g.287910  ORF Transcript_100521/g.287910 Transcript_100521/m.287910 type:complete len:135 (+) Transcript_100521:1467-1871(+)
MTRPGVSPRQPPIHIRIRFLCLCHLVALIVHRCAPFINPRYRSIDEIKKWKEDVDPISRFRNYLEKEGLWSQDEDTQLRSDERLEVLKALEAAETAGKPSLEEMFTDVFDEKPAHLVEQEEAMLAHIAKYPDKY